MVMMMMTRRETNGEYQHVLREIFFIHLLVMVMSVIFRTLGSADGSRPSGAIFITLVLLVLGLSTFPLGRFSGRLANMLLADGGVHIFASHQCCIGKRHLRGDRRRWTRDADAAHAAPDA